MSPHIHEVNESRHGKFLSEGRRDPFTKEKLKAGDRIVFCAGCKSAFLHSSWEAMRGKHCNQTETLAEFPDIPRLGNVAKLQGKIQVLTVACYLLITGIAGLGYFVYDQYQRIKSLQSQNLDRGSQVFSLEQQRDRVKQKISVLNNKLASDNCRNDIPQPTRIEEQVSSFEQKIDCFVREHKNFKNERNFYQKALNSYPYTLSSGSEVNYRGYLSTSNNESNPILYRLYVPNGSRFDIYLQDMEADGDFEIIDSEGTRVENSRRTNTGRDKLKNFYLYSGIYNIKIWNYSSGRSTYFILRVNRQ